MGEAPKEIWIDTNEPWYGTVNPKYGVGDLTPYTRDDIVAARVAEAVAAETERCARIAYRVCAETRHMTLADAVDAAIRQEVEG